MDEIVILEKMPVILTKDRRFVQCWPRKEKWDDIHKRGGVVLLPEDAVLVCRDEDEDN